MNTPTFSETQKFKQVWVWVLVGLVMGGALAFLWWGIYQQVYLGHPFGDHPRPDGALVLGVLFETFMCIVIAAVLGSIKMVVETGPDALQVRFFPFKKMEISYGNIREFQVRDYQPLKEFGGWGMRRSWDGKTKAFNMSGRRGVELFLLDGSRVMLGSLRADELGEVLKGHRVQEMMKTV